MPSNYLQTHLYLKSNFSQILLLISKEFCKLLSPMLQALLKKYKNDSKTAWNVLYSNIIYFSYFLILSMKLVINCYQFRSNCLALSLTLWKTSLGLEVFSMSSTWHPSGLSRGSVSAYRLLQDVEGWKKLTPVWWASLRCPETKKKCENLITYQSLSIFLYAILALLSSFHLATLLPSSSRLQ